MCIYIYIYINIIYIYIYIYMHACIYIYTCFFHSHWSKVGITYCSIHVDGLHLVFFTSDDNLMVIMNCLE